MPRCPACGDPIDYCQGHGRNADPHGWLVLSQHDSGDHTNCCIVGCPDAVARKPRQRVLRW